MGKRLSLYEKYVYSSIDDIRFGIWLEKNDWEFYDSDERMINMKAGKIVVTTKELFSEYKKETRYED